MSEFAGLVAIVTGGASGIGLATAKLLHGRGAGVAALDLDPDGLPDDIVGVYNSVATLIVYFWVVPYLLICAGALRLLGREGRLGPLAVIGAALGAAAMTWMYLNGLVNPPAPPLDAMSYVAVVAVAAVFAAFLVVDRLGRARRGATHQTHH